MWEKENTRHSAAHAVRHFCDSESSVCRLHNPKNSEAKSLYTAPQISSERLLLSAVAAVLFKSCRLFSAQMRRLRSVNTAVSFVLAVGHCLAMVIYQN